MERIGLVLVCVEIFSWQTATATTVSGNAVCMLWGRGGSPQLLMDKMLQSDLGF